MATSNVLPMQSSPTDQIGRKKVCDKSSDVEAMSEEWGIASALMGGTSTMREAGAKYLPKNPQETSANYNIRKATATLFPAYKRTVETLASKPFSKPVTIEEETDPKIKEWLDNIDLQGRNIDMFSVSLMEDALSHGLCGIFVEYPKVPEVQEKAAQPLSVADEKSRGLRPYWIHIRPTQILGWIAKLEGETWSLQQLRIMESVKEKDPQNEFFEIEVQQVRVLEIGKWRTFRESKDPSGRVTWVMHERGTTTLDAIPFAPVYGGRTGFMMARPPLIEMAHLNIKHWQSQSEQDSLLHMARVPILARTGMVEKHDASGNLMSNELIIGAGVAVDIPTNCTLGWVEHNGTSIDAGKISLDDLKEEMRQAGAELLVISKGPVTATEIAGDNAIAMCHLQRTTKGLEDAIDLAMQYTANYIRSSSPGSVELYSDFGATTLAEATAQLLLSMATAGKLSDETLFAEMQRRGIISSDVEFEDEKERIESQGPQPGSLEYEQAMQEMEGGAGGEPGGGGGGGGGGGESNPWAGMSGANLMGGPRTTIKG